MYCCFDVANYFLKLAKREGESVSPYRLMKLTFLAHGWHLGFKSKALFYNVVEMWKYGIVIPDLYYVIRRFGQTPVYKDVVELYVENKLTEQDKEFVKIIWDAYKRLNGLEVGAKVSDHSVYFEEKLQNGDARQISIYLIEDCYKNLISDKRC